MDAPWTTARLPWCSPAHHRSGQRAPTHLSLRSRSPRLPSSRASCGLVRHCVVRPTVRVAGLLPDLPPSWASRRCAYTALFASTTRPDPPRAPGIRSALSLHGRRPRQPGGPRRIVTIGTASPIPRPSLSFEMRSSFTSRVSANRASRFPCLRLKARWSRQRPLDARTEQERCSRRGQGATLLRPCRRRPRGTSAARASMTGRHLLPLHSSATAMRQRSATSCSSAGSVVSLGGGTWKPRCSSSWACNAATISLEPGIGFVEQSPIHVPTSHDEAACGLVYSARFRPPPQRAQSKPRRCPIRQSGRRPCRRFASSWQRPSSSIRHQADVPTRTDVARK